MASKSIGDRIGELIRVSGTVQGVGFRPTVWQLARTHGLTGAVWNDGAGVAIEAWGSRRSLEGFVVALSRDCPPLARVSGVERVPLEGENPPGEFEIRASAVGMVRTDIAADAAICGACRAEILNPDDRRHRYPFTNCTHCGPRLSIVRAIPYDRANTSMSGFPMCPDCCQEYEDPADRRFHAQPNACWHCGPVVWLERGANGERLDGDEDPVKVAAGLLARGEILAIKGIGGIHLACDACNAQAVDELRRRKHRYQKAFALMARDLRMVRRYAVAGPDEALLLGAPAAPIVILEAADEPVAKGVAPAQSTLGFMLPYTPLHHMLMEGLDRPIVLTSGNRSDEPQCTDNQDARKRLRGIADYMLLHDRDIVNRLDDSVTRFVSGAPRTLRRARGYAPGPVMLPPGFGDGPQLLAMGGELKNTFCLLQQGRAILSQHMGDLENAVTFRDYRHNLSLFLDLFQHRPQAVAVDLHPGYLSSKEGAGMAAQQGLELIGVQHHHAHIAACMAEKGLPQDTSPVLGVALDGLGYGDDETFWGAEFLLADYRGYQRLAHFRPAPLPGGEQAMREPWRNLFAQLCQAPGWEWVQRRYGRLDSLRLLRQKPVQSLTLMVEKGLNSPLASSCGRLFDAVAAALGICVERQSFEGQAAMELETRAVPHFSGQVDRAYPWSEEMSEGTRVIGFEPLWLALLEDLDQRVDAGVISARFHQGVCSLVAEVSAAICSERGVRRVVLGGGVFQNRLLLEGVSERLQALGLSVLSPEAVPANDGGLSLGQAVVASVKMQGDQKR